jgi:rsbT co-antagonist protein RsbR
MNSKSGLDEITPVNLKDVYDLNDEGLKKISDLKPLMDTHMESFISRFYEWLGQRPEFEQFFADAEHLKRVQGLQSDYWINFFAARVDEAYVERLRVLGRIHAHIGLSLEAYMSGVNLFMTMFTETICDPANKVSDPVEAVSLVTKLLHLDTVVVVSTFTDRTQHIINEQSQSLMQLSTPVSMLWDDILMLPIVGIVDSKRAQDIMDAMLLKIAETTARVMILDISGVSIIDTAVANHFIKMTKATTLMGCRSVISGISPMIAQTIVSLGIDLAEINTRSTLKDALAFAFAETGHKAVMTS